MINSHLKGQKGEEIAKKYLLKRGYSLVAQNWKSKRGEVDLIVKKGGVLTFVEVKYRKTPSFGIPHVAIGLAKQKKIVAAALDYLQRHRLQNNDFRLAALTIQEESSGPKVDFFEFPLDLPVRYY